MESSQAHATAEEHGGSEYGWTMYINSPIQSENDDYKDIHVHNDGDGDDDDDESDNSMASDASSGPSHRELPCGKGEGSGSIVQNKHAKNEANSSSTA
nr:sodium/hydrogen exchanger 1-like [Quercus suber]